VASLAVAAACGIALNMLITSAYGAGALGVFNQVFALYFVFSQLAAAGIHYSALQEVAATSDARERGAAATSAFAATILLAAAVAVAFHVLGPVAGAALGSPGVARGMAYAAPGLFLFALDKVALGCINGANRMRAYAVLFAARFVLLIAAFGVCAAAGVDADALPIVITIAETGTLGLCAPVIAPMLGPVPRAELWVRIRRHLRFGVKGVGGGLLAELNTRVDVLMLGAFATDAVVGAYSFAAMLAEGAFQLLIVLRTNYAPLLTRLYAAGEIDALRAAIRRGRNVTYAGSVAAGALVVAGYAVVIPRLSGDPAVAASGPMFGVLIAGMVAASGYVPFNQMLLYARRPGWHTVSVLAILVINVIANAVLIQVLGAVGAATGTAVAFAASVAILLVLCRKLLGLAI
jgi:O-antigen/teichoic acid export membrane protein